jgi:hypothetical protein
MNHTAPFDTDVVADLLIDQVLAEEKATTILNK